MRVKAYVTRTAPAVIHAYNLVPVVDVANSTATVKAVRKLFMVNTVSDYVQINA